MHGRQRNEMEPNCNNPGNCTGATVIISRTGSNYHCQNSSVYGFTCEYVFLTKTILDLVYVCHYSLPLK